MRAAFGNYPHDCTLCINDPALRQAWGCDEDAPSAIDRRPCKCGQHKDCEECKGSGFIQLRRCPYTVIPSNVYQTLRYAALAREGFFPEPGGALDQSQSFLDALSVINHEIRDLEENRAQ